MKKCYGKKEKFHPLSKNVWIIKNILGILEISYLEQLQLIKEMWTK